MFKEPIVIDNVISKRYQEHVRDSLLSAKIEWFYQPDITYPMHKMPEGFIPKPGLSHLYYDNVRSPNPLSPWFHMIWPIALEACDKMNIVFDELMRARSFLHFPTDPNSKLLNHPHIDYEIPHLVLLYYVNDSDGPTVLYNETLVDIKEKDLSLDKLTVKMEVEPRQGRMVIFDGHTYHSSTQPTKSSRCIVNYNLLGAKYATN